MRVFVTGATGFIGAAVARELIDNGHHVTALCRSPDKAPALAALGADVFAGSLNDLERLREGARAADGIVHAAFDHDFSNFAANCEADRRVIAALGEAALVAGGPLLVTSGTLVADAPPGRPVSEQDPAKPVHQMPRAATEEATILAAAQGARAFAIRPAHVHDARRQAALLAWLIELAHGARFSAYVGDGEQRWAACPLSDTARLYRLALEAGECGACYHAVSEEGVPVREIAEAIGRLLDVPARGLTSDEASTHFGDLAHFVGMDGRATSKITRDRLGWTPTGQGLIADLDGMPRPAH